MFDIFWGVFFKKTPQTWECVCVCARCTSVSVPQQGQTDEWLKCRPGPICFCQLCSAFCAHTTGHWRWFAHMSIHSVCVSHMSALIFWSVRVTCVNLLKSSAAGVCLFRDKADKSLLLSRWSSPQIGRNIIRMKRECGSRRDHFCAWKFISLISGGERKCPLKPACALIFHLHHCVENWVIRLNINPNLFCRFTLSELVLHPQQCLNVTLSRFSVYL